MCCCLSSFFFFFFTDTATTEIYTLSLHDALPISTSCVVLLSSDTAPEMCSMSSRWRPQAEATSTNISPTRVTCADRSEEHTSELQSQFHLVCRLLLEKKKKTNRTIQITTTTHTAT